MKIGSFYTAYGFAVAALVTACAVLLVISERLGWGTP
jgi:hypothetical protein